jgi:hypothetical protein
MGIREVSNEEDAGYVIDVVTKDLFSGRGDGPVAGTAVGAAVGAGLGAGLASSGVLNPGQSAGVALGALLVGALVDEGNTPYFVALSADLVVDELVPPDPVKTVSKKGKKAKAEEVQEPRAVQHKTVFTNWVKYMGHQAVQGDAIPVLKANLVRAITNSFR